MYSRNCANTEKTKCRKFETNIPRKGVGDAYCLGGVLWKHRRLLTAEYVTNNFSRRYTTQQRQLEADNKE